MRDRGTVIQKKTGRPVHFEITEQTRASIRDWLAEVDLRGGRNLFPRRFHTQPHLSTRQYTRIVHAWVESAGLDSSAYGTHSMRRTKVAHLSENRQPASGPAVAGPYKAGERRPLPRDRGR